MCIKYKKIKKLYRCKFSTRSVLFKEKTKTDFFSSHILFIYLFIFRTPGGQNGWFNKSTKHNSWEIQLSCWNVAPLFSK